MYISWRSTEMEWQNYISIPVMRIAYGVAIICYGVLSYILFYLWYSQFIPSVKIII